MISRLSYLATDSVDPCRNLALEEYLTFQCEEDECILYLWQNQKTVVIGKNQNPWKECKLHALEEDGGQLVRRMSGGGAVFHDLGNLNFTFCIRKEHYHVEKQLRVIIRAVQSFGLCAVQTGRNDIVVDGRKFSGNAFFESGDYCYHHGTILIDVDMQKLGQYLNVSRKKLESKGVDSVRSRVVNLKELEPGITIDSMKQALKTAFAEEYEREAKEIQPERLNQSEIHRMEEKYRSWEWRLGRKIPFQYEMGTRFPWGDLEMKLQINGGVIQDIICYSDAMNQTYIEELAEALKGCRYDEHAMIQAVEGVQPSNEEDTGKMKSDVIQWIQGTIEE